MQMGVGIRQSVADVDTDSLLSQNWPPSPSVRLEKLLGNRICHYGQNTDGNAPLSLSTRSSSNSHSLSDCGVSLTHAH